MSTLIVAFLSFVGFIVAYNTYGLWLGGKVFSLDDSRITPSHALQDDIDFAPTRTSVLFGHHFTAIAGTGPIVGPAIAVCWGWLPALLWVVFGAIFIGAVHDMTALVISMRNQGKSIGDVAKTLVSQRVRILFLLLLCFVLTLVVAVFCTVISGVFIKFPQSVLCVWLSIPMASLIGFWNYKIKGNLLTPVIAGVCFMYFLVYLGTYYFPISIHPAYASTAEIATGAEESTGTSAGSDIQEPVPVGIIFRCGEHECQIPMIAHFCDPMNLWTTFLLIYCFIASILPVWLLLQPRDFINGCQLYVALFLLVVGLICAAVFQKADLVEATPAVVSVDSLAADGITSESPLIKTVLPLWPFLFITVACGAISGFHALVSGGTTSKQINQETDAKLIGYGAMLMEGALAVIVILACTAGVSLRSSSVSLAQSATKETEAFEGIDVSAKSDGLSDIERLTLAAKEAKEKGTENNLRQNWLSHYNKSWSEIGSSAVGTFVEGGGNFLAAMGLPVAFAMGLMGVLIASFAATTLDAATRLQRYVLQELGLKNMYLATLIVVFMGAALACMPSPTGKGTMGMLLWPVFGATNQLLASLTLIICMVYLKRYGRPLFFLILPLIIMTILPFWAMIDQMITWYGTKGAPIFGIVTNNHLMLALGTLILAIQVWVLVEGFYTLGKTIPVTELDSSDAADNKVA